VTPELLCLSIRGLELRAMAWGPKNAPPLLALHGWLDNCATFIPLMQHLFGFRVVALDLPGHGHSDWRPASATYHFADWIPFAFDVADSLGWRGFSILGHCMGAGIGSLMAGACPERIERLVLIDGIGPGVYEDEETPERVATHLKQRLRTARRAPLPYKSRHEMAEKLSKVVEGLRPDCAQFLVERGSREVAGGYVWRCDPRLRRSLPIRFNEAQVLAFLRRIEAPTLVLRAHDGMPAPEGLVERRLSCVRNYTLIQCGGGHHLHMTRPAETAAEIVSWFKGLS